MSGRSWGWVLAGALAVAGCARPQDKKGGPAAPPPPVVEVSEPVSREVTDFEDFTGRVGAVMTINVRGRITGYLDKVHFKDGDDVKKGDLLFEIDDRPYRAELERAEGNARQAEARVQRLERDYNRAKGNFAKGAISREEYDRISGDYAEATAAIGAVKGAYDLAKLNLEYCRVTAPIGGRLSRRVVDPGNLVRADDTVLTTLVSLDPMYAYFEIDERTLLRLRRLIREGKIQSRREKTLSVLIGLADEEGFPHQGSIDFSDNIVDPSTGTLQVRGVIPNPQPYILSPGLFIRVRLPIGQPRQALLVAEQAIGTDQGRKYVYVVNKKDEVERRPVDVGLQEGGLRVIEKGLEPGERVVVTGLQRIRSGIKVNAKLRPAESLTRDDEPPADGNAAATARANSNG